MGTERGHSGDGAGTLAADPWKASEDAEVKVRMTNAARATVGLMAAHRNVSIAEYARRLFRRDAGDFKRDASRRKK